LFENERSKKKITGMMIVKPAFLKLINENYYVPFPDK